MEKAQMLKGLLEGCILEIISHGETYGYLITERLNDFGFSDLNEGSVYPVLMRLEKKKLVTTESRKSELGPRRKYFSLNDHGRQYLNDFHRLWGEISQTVNRIMEGGDNNE